MGLLAPVDVIPSLLALVAAVINVDEPNHSQHATESELINQSFLLLCALFRVDPSALQLLYASPLLSDVLLGGLVTSKNGLIRRKLAQNINLICANFQTFEKKSVGDVSDPRAVLLPLMLSCLARLTDGASSDFFVPLQTMLAHSDPDELRKLQPEQRIGALAHMLARLPVDERTTGPPDELLCGLLAVLTTLLQKLPELHECEVAASGEHKGLLDIVCDCLFELPTPEHLTAQRGGSTLSARARALLPPPKCKQSNSRTLAFNLLLELTKHSMRNSAKLIERLAPHHVAEPADPAALKANKWHFEVSVLFPTVPLPQICLYQTLHFPLFAAAPMYTDHHICITLSPSCAYMCLPPCVRVGYRPQRRRRLHVATWG